MCVAILAIVAPVLTMAFMVMFKGSQATTGQVADIADAQRIGAAWTADVQSVDRGGVNSAESCPSRFATASPTLAETTLVTFEWNVGSGTIGPRRSASWVAVGTGRDMKVTRRYCEAGAPISEQTLADHIGKKGQTVADVVHGPGTPANDFCPAKNLGTSVAPVMVSSTCTIVVSGSFDYRLAVTRRVAARDSAAVSALAPTAPTVTSATPRHSYITVAWTPPTLAVGSPQVTAFRVMAYLNPDSPAVASVDVDGGSNSVSISSLTDGVAYFIRIQAQNAVGWGDLSASYGPVTPLPTGPDQPTIVSVTAGDRSVAVTWSANSNNGGSPVTSWKIYASPTSGAEVGPVSVAGGGATGGTITGLTGLTTYTIQVVAVNAVGDGTRSSPSAGVVPYGPPGKATFAALTQNSDGSITIGWSAPSDGGSPITGYQVAVSGAGAGGPWPPSGTFSPATTSATLSGLTAGSTYSFIVTTFNAAGGTASNPSNGTLARKVPGIPTGVAAVQNGLGTIDVSWTAPSTGGSPITSYSVRTSPAISGTPRTVSSGTATSFTGLSAGTAYSFYVTATNVAGSGGESGGASAVALGVPQAPTIGAVTAGNSQLTVSWTANSNDGGSPVTAWKVYAYSGATLVSTTPISSATAVSGSVLSLSNGTAYTLKVAAVNALGDGVQSAASVAATPYTVPGAPVTSTVTSNADGSISLAWSAPASNGGSPVTGYRVTVSSGGSGGPWPTASTQYASTATTATLSGLTLGNTYTFTVTAFNAAGNTTSVPSTSALARAVPGSPTGVTAVAAGTGAATVNWGAAAPNGSPVTNYYVRSSIAIAGQTTFDAGTSLSLPLTGLTSGTSYTFYLSAKNVAGTGTESVGVSVTASGVPGAPAAPTLARSGTSYPFAVSVGWSRPTNTGAQCIVKYQVDYSTDGSAISITQNLTAAPGAYPACSGEPAVNLTQTGLAAGVDLRYFRVTAYNATGASSPSAWSSIHLSQACNLSATEDSWTNQNNGVFGLGSKRGTNYGSDQTMNVNSDGSDMWVKFDPQSSGSNCSQISAPLPSTAVIEGTPTVSIYNSSPTSYNRNISIDRVTASWSEGSITYNNRPATTGSDEGMTSSQNSGYRTFNGTTDGAVGHEALSHGSCGAMPARSR